MILALLLAGNLCGAEAQNFLWDSVKADAEQETRVVVSLSNFEAFRSPANRQAFLDVLEDLVALASDLDAGTIARAAGRVGISADGVEEWISAVNYYRDATKAGNPIIVGLIDFADPSAPGASRNLARVAGAATIEQAVAEMFEPVALRRMGILPQQVRGFGVKINVSRYPGVTTGTIEADGLLVDLTFVDDKWGTYAASVKQEQLSNLTIVLSDTTFPDRPISRVLFPFNTPVDPAVKALIDNANAAIREARGIKDPSVVFIEARDLGPFR